MFRNLSTDALGFAAPQNEEIEMALTYGFRGIDLRIADFTQQVESWGMEKARRLIDSARSRPEPEVALDLGTFRLPVNLLASDETYEREMKLLAGRARVAAEVGCQRAVTTISPASDDRPMQDNFEFHRQRLSEISNALGECNVRLGIGFQAPKALREGKAHEFIHDLDALMKLAETVGIRNIGIVLDFWQLYVSGRGIDALDAVPVEQIIAVQISGAPADVPAGDLTNQQRCIPGEGGGLDVVACIQALSAKGYEGPVTPVVHPSQLHGKRRDHAVRITGKSLDEVWRAAGLPGSSAFRTPEPVPETPAPATAKPAESESKESESPEPATAAASASDDGE